MSASDLTPDPGSVVEPAQADAAPALLDGRTKLHVKEKSRWSDAVKPLPAILERLERRPLGVTVLLFTFLAVKVIVVAKGNIPTALGIFQATNPAVTVIGALLSGLPLGAVAVLVIG